MDMMQGHFQEPCLIMRQPSREEKLHHMKLLGHFIDKAFCMGAESRRAERRVGVHARHITGFIS